MRIEPQISTANIVVLGAFNPPILTPAWFVLHDLLPSGVETSANVQVVHSKVTAFTADWLDLRVREDRFQVGSGQAPYVRVLDLVSQIFKNLLPHTPIHAFGVNREVHFPVKDQTVRHRIGRVLAPVEPWGECGRSLGLDGPHGGMRSLTMSQFHPEGRADGGEINVRVGPSDQPDPERGVFVSVNDHYVVDPHGTEAGDRFVNLLAENFQTSLARSDEIIDHVMSLATAYSEQS